MSTDDNDLMIKARGTVSPPAGKAFCPECYPEAVPECPTCDGTWLIDATEEVS